MGACVKAEAGVSCPGFLLVVARWRLRLLLVFTFAFQWRAPGRIRRSAGLPVWI